jgi:hypothetical protein
VGRGLGEALSFHDRVVDTVPAVRGMPADRM